MIMINEERLLDVLLKWYEDYQKLSIGSGAVFKSGYISGYRDCIEDVRYLLDVAWLGDNPDLRGHDHDMKKCESSGEQNVDLIADPDQMSIEDFLTV